MLRSLLQHSTIPKRKRNNKLFLNRITRVNEALDPAIGNMVPAEEVLGHSYYIHWCTLDFISSICHFVTSVQWARNSRRKMLCVPNNVINNLPTSC